MANKRRPHNSASCNGYKWRLCAPLIPSGIIARIPLPRCMYLELNEQREREREIRRGDEKKRETAINRFERRIDRKFSLPPPVSAPLSPRSWPACTNFFRSSCERANGRKCKVRVCVCICRMHPIFFEKVNKAMFHFLVSRKKKKKQEQLQDA